MTRIDQKATLKCGEEIVDIVVGPSGISRGH